MKLLDSSIPFKAVLSLLAGCAAFTGGAVKFGEWVGGNDARGASIERRIVVLETSDHARNAIEARIDRRLYRLEIERHIAVPKEDRFDAVGP